MNVVSIGMRKLVVGALLVVLVAGVGATAVFAKPLLLRAMLKQQAAYFNDSATQPRRLERVRGKVLTFDWDFDRTIVVETSQGLVVVDPFNERLAMALRTALADSGVDTSVHTMIYTHFHRDHVQGGAALRPARVLAHVASPQYWLDYPLDERNRIAPPTQLLDGDTEIVAGDTRIQLLYLGESHTRTMYAVYFPDLKVLYGADLLAIRALLPGGGISLYDPGYMRALERLARLPFEVFVSSHFGWGTKRDYLEAVQFQRDLRRLVQQSLARRSDSAPLFMKADALRLLLDDVTPRLRDKYGGWHGFESQVVPSILSVYTSLYVGT